MKFRTRYDPGDNHQYGYSSDKPTMTKQSFKDECDINNIINRYNKTGLVDHVMKGEGKYGDFQDAEDYLQSCQKVIEAQEAFQALPSHVRLSFQNDPYKFLVFALDPSNSGSLVKMGLATPSGGKALSEEKKADIQSDI